MWMLLSAILAHLSLLLMGSWSFDAILAWGLFAEVKTILMRYDFGSLRELCLVYYILIE